VAFDYAALTGKAGLLFEINMGMIDRGAEYEPTTKRETLAGALALTSRARDAPVQPLMALAVPA
jgi:hypothetical protein